MIPQTLAPLAHFVIRSAPVLCHKQMQPNEFVMKPSKCCRKGSAPEWLSGMLDIESGIVTDCNVSHDKRASTPRTGSPAPYLTEGHRCCNHRYPAGIRRWTHRLPAGRQARKNHPQEKFRHKQAAFQQQHQRALQRHHQGPPKVSPRILLPATRILCTVSGVIQHLPAPFWDGLEDTCRGAGHHTGGTGYAADGHTARGPARRRMPKYTAVHIAADYIARLHAM